MDEKAKNELGAAGNEYELAGIGARFFAAFIDAILLALMLTLILLLIHAAGGGAAQLAQFFSLAIPVGYYWYFWTQRDGQTPGKFALRIRVVKADGSEICNTDAVIRAIGYHVSAVLCGLGYIWAIFDRNNQAWHDKLARTYVVRADGHRKTVHI